MGVLRAQFQQLDNNIFLWVQKKYCKKSLFPYIKFISSTGDGWLYVVIGICALSYDLKNNLDFFYNCLVSYAIQVPLYLILKHHFKRNRPADFFAAFEASIKPSDQFSFPSGHTAAAFVMAIQISAYFPSLIMIAFMWALSIGIARILLGVHFLGDIIAGVFLGLFSTMLATAIYG